MRLSNRDGPRIEYTRSGENWLVTTGAVSVWVSYGSLQAPVGIFISGETIPGVSKFMIEVLPDQETAALVQAQGAPTAESIARLFGSYAVSRLSAPDRVRYWLAQWVRGGTLRRIHQSYLGRLAGVSRELAARTIAQMSVTGEIRTEGAGKHRFVANGS